MTVLTTARLRFEPFDDCHAVGLHAMNRDPAVQRYLLGCPVAVHVLERVDAAASIRS